MIMNLHKPINIEKYNIIPLDSKIKFCMIYDGKNLINNFIYAIQSTGMITLIALILYIILIYMLYNKASRHLMDFFSNNNIIKNSIFMFINLIYSIIILGNAKPLRKQNGVYEIEYQKLCNITGNICLEYNILRNALMAKPFICELYNLFYIKHHNKEIIMYNLYEQYNQYLINSNRLTFQIYIIFNIILLLMQMYIYHYSISFLNIIFIICITILMHFIQVSTKYLPSLIESMKEII